MLCALLAAGASARAMPLADHFRESWGTRDGLPHSYINGIAQTPDGYLWLATWEGLARYDGREFALFGSDRIPGLVDNGVRALHLGPSGTLWVGGARGALARLRNGRWQAIAPVGHLVLDLAEDRAGRLWVATATGGLIMVDRDGRVAHLGKADGLPSDAVAALCIDRAGQLWVGTTQGLGRVVDGKVSVLPPSAAMAQRSILTILAQPDGSVLVGTDQGAFRGSTGQFEVLHPDFAKDAVFKLWSDPEGAVWVGTARAGLARLEGGRIERLGSAQGLPSNFITALARDHEGSLWVGTSTGLVRLRAAPFRSFGRSRGLSDDFVRTVLPARGGGVWVGTSKGLNRVDAAAQSSRVVGAGTELADSTVLSLASGPRGDLWVGTQEDGLLRWNGSAITARLGRQQGLRSNEIRAVLQARSGTVWVGTADGLTRVGAAGVRNFGVDEGLPSAYILSLHEAFDGTVWVGTTKGAARIRGDAITALDLVPVGDAQFVFSFLSDPASGHVWLATDRGLVRVRASDGRRTRVSRADGLRFDKIFAMVPDRTGHVWLTCNIGVMRVRLADLEAVADGRSGSVRVDLYGDRDGMASAQANGGSSPSAGLDVDGAVWIATAAGVARVNPAQLTTMELPAPPVVIESFQVDGRELQVRDGQVLAPGSNRVGFRFAGLSFVMAGRLGYRYFLKGFDSEWSALGQQRDVRYTNLAPGDYEFRVAAIDTGTSGQLSEAVLRFSIEPYLWQHWGFWGAAGGAVALLLGSIYAVRIRQVGAREANLRALVEARTAELQTQADELRHANLQKAALVERLRAESVVSERLARTDSLTGLANRRAFDEAMTNELQRTWYGVPSRHLLMIDIDHFKRINDRYSHATGDRVLQEVAAVLEANCRPEDLASRWGGEEFAVLLTQCTLQEASLAAERIREKIAAIDFTEIAPGLTLTASVGIASQASLHDFDRMIVRADEALYRAKAEGRNRVCVG